MHTRLFTPADILLPKDVDMSKWSVIACDQFTSQPDYWEQVQQYVGNAPSAYHLIYPEAYLGKEEPSPRIEAINRTMREYLEHGIFRVCPDCFLYVERKLLDGSIRHGLVGKVDLEAYDYTSGSKSPIRPTEGTVESRLPPRVRIREHASLELPHVLALIDDPGCTVIEPIVQSLNQYEKAYDFTLRDGGPIRGYVIPRDKAGGVLDALGALLDPLDRPGEVAIPVGDGNHSLATAKACFEKVKAALPKEQWENHPSRWALVELVNLHDPALRFEPVHRVVFHTNPAALLDALGNRYPTGSAGDKVFPLRYVAGGKQGIVELGLPKGILPVGPVQEFLDEYLQSHTGEADYIHDEDAVRSLSNVPDAVGLYLPPMDKSALTPTVRQKGALPRKTFSLGHAREKRYYLEARKIIP